MEARHLGAYIHCTMKSLIVSPSQTLSSKKCVCVQGTQVSCYEETCMGSLVVCPWRLQYLIVSSMGKEGLEDLYLQAVVSC